MKILSIMWKDIVTRFSDLNGLLLMLVAPLVITAIMGAAFSRFGGGQEPIIQDIPVVIINEDEGGAGDTVMALLRSGDLITLLSPLEVETSLLQAQDQLARGDIKGVIYIPAGYTQGLLAHIGGNDNADGNENLVIAPLKLYTEPSDEVETLVVKQITAQIVDTMVALASETQSLAVTENEANKTISTDMEERFMAALDVYREEGFQTLITFDNKVIDNNGNRISTNPLAYFAPSMAIFFLLFSMFESTQSILKEKRDGTLKRMMLSPTRLNEILLVMAMSLR